MNEIEEKIEKTKKTLNNSGWLIKSAYMASLLSPNDETHYVIFEEDEPKTFKYQDNDIQLKKGHVLFETDERVPWDTIEAKYRQMTNTEFFRHISLGYIEKEAIVVFLENNTSYDKTSFKEDDDIKNNTLIKKILEPFNNTVYMELADYQTLRYFIETDEDVVNFFKQPKENVSWEVISRFPVSLILFYLIKKHQTELIKNWKFSTSELKELLRIMNISEDVL